jgi:heme-degrading monooxygenase HmoA
VIARTWRGATRAADAERYAEYVRRTGIESLRATPGNRGAWVMYRLDGERAEFLVVSFWKSLEAVRGFAGDDIARAVFYPEDERYLIERDEIAEHWQA